jgi:osmoprotectant transport system permease protein
MLTIALCFAISFSQAQTMRVGAKHFNESYILGEMMAQLLEEAGFEVERKFNLGGTTVCFEALRNNDIDVYPEYTGSLEEEILKSDVKLGHDQLNHSLQQKMKLEISQPLGFNNTYAIALLQVKANQMGLKKMSDLENQAALRGAVSYEFLKRKDGWENLKKTYRLPMTPVGIEHGLAYQALMSRKTDFTDVYSTDGEIEKYDLKLLDDDLNFFPEYQAVAFYHTGWNSKAKAAVQRLEGMINESEMQRMNAEVLYAGKNFAEVASDFLRSKNLASTAKQASNTILKEIVRKTFDHLWITAIALIFAIAVALPLGILLYTFSSISRPVLYLVSLLQTVPSIALLALMIPLLGIGQVPAIVALFLYALLPILRNTTAGLSSVDPVLKKVSKGMGMTPFQRLRWVEVPLAMPSILAGIRTAAVITIGTATLAAFIGAGGLGEFIVTGLALNNTSLILQGAIPAALLAILVEFLFELIEKVFIPRHLQKQN